MKKQSRKNQKTKIFRFWNVLETPINLTLRKKWIFLWLTLKIIFQVYTQGLNKIDNGELSWKLIEREVTRSLHLCHTQFVFISFKSFKFGKNLLYMLWFISIQIIKQHWVMYFQECLMFYIFSFNHRKRHIAKTTRIYTWCL